MQETTLTYKQGTSDKWWNIVVDGFTLHTSWGRTGSTGQKKSENFANNVFAKDEYWKRINAKKRKGYIEAPNTSMAPTEEQTDASAEALRKMLEEL